jgi:hypothetical protein
MKNTEPRDPFDDLSAELDRNGLDEASKKIRFLLHDCAWTTSSELYGELGLALRAIRQEHWCELDTEARRAFRLATAAVEAVWPDFET